MVVAVYLLEFCGQLLEEGEAELADFDVVGEWGDVWLVHLWNIIWKIIAPENERLIG